MSGSLVMTTGVGIANVLANETMLVLKRDAMRKE